MLTDMPHGRQQAKQLILTVKQINILQRMDIGKYFFINRTIKNWNQLPAESLETVPCKPKIFRNIVRKAIINGVK
jgi:hypothetical protein